MPHYTLRHDVLPLCRVRQKLSSEADRNIVVIM